MNEPISIVEKLQASIDLVSRRKAAELFHVAHAAALALAVVVKRDTGEISLGCGWHPEVVREFARLADSEVRRQAMRDGPPIIWANANFGGVGVRIQGREES